MESIRNKLGWGLSGALTLLLLAALAGVVHGGPLDPTAPPGSTGKNVITSLPFTISQPGSYVLNSNLTGVSGQNGITINVSNVTIDLQGFELVGVGAGSTAGIVSQAGQSNFTVRNGTVRSWPGYGLQVGDGAVVDNLQAIGNGTGIVVGHSSRLSNCRSQGSTLSLGILAGNRTVLTSCIAVGNGGTEISAGTSSVLENCVADGTGTGGVGIEVGAGSTVRGCSTSNNGASEITAGDRSTVESCVADGAGSAGLGISVGADSIVRGCTATNNGTDEITLGDRSVVEDCVADGWTGSVRGPGAGISVGIASVVRGCNVANNGNIGIRVNGSYNRIESNRVRGNDVAGFFVSGSGNFVALNDASLNGTTASDNCVGAAGNDFVVVFTSAGANSFDNVCD